MLIAVQAFRRLRQYTLIRISRRVWCSNFKFLINTHHPVPWWRSLSGRTTITTTQENERLHKSWFLSRRDSTIVAMPRSALQFGHLRRHVGEFSPRLSQGQSVARSGLKSVAQGLPWVVLPTRIRPEAEGARKGPLGFSPFHPRTPTQAGSLCYIALGVSSDFRNAS